MVEILGDKAKEMSLLAILDREDTHLSTQDSPTRMEETTTTNVAEVKDREVVDARAYLNAMAQVDMLSLIHI